MNKTINTIDEYISAQSNKNTRDILEKIRETINHAIPGSKEKISYGIPTFTLNSKNIIHFGGYENHIGLYPGSSGVSNFADKLKEYDTSKGTIRFPLDKPMPYGLIAEISEFCANNSK